MAKELIKDIQPTVQAPAVQKKAKDRGYNLKKRKHHNPAEEDESAEDKNDFVEDVKTALKYGDVGHGVILDKKV